MKHLYHILISIGIIIGHLPAQAQIYSTVHRTNTYHTATNDYYSQPSFRVNTRCSSHAFPIDSLYTEIQFANGHIQTAAAKLGDGILADDWGYISPKSSNSSNEDDDDIYEDEDSSQAPPTIAPLAFDWQVMLFILLLCFIYVLWTIKHHKSQISEEKN